MFRPIGRLKLKRSPIGKNRLHRLKMLGRSALPVSADPFSFSLFLFPLSFSLPLFQRYSRNSCSETLVHSRANIIVYFQLQVIMSSSRNRTNVGIFSVSIWKKLKTKGTLYNTFNLMKLRNDLTRRSFFFFVFLTSLT